MSAEFFLDTNILVYTFDSKYANKRARARELVESALQNKRGRNQLPSRTGVLERGHTQVLRTDATRCRARLSKSCSGTPVRCISEYRLVRAGHPPARTLALRVL